MSKLLPIACLLWACISTSCDTRAKKKGDPIAVDPVPATRSVSNEEQITAIAVQRILRAAATDDVRVTPKCICIARTADFAAFDPPSPRLMSILRKQEPRTVPASECALQEKEWGRVVRRFDSGPAILIGARAYIFERERKAFVLGNWYVNSMRAQRFVFVFQFRNGQWIFDDGSKLGVI